MLPHKRYYNYLEMLQKQGLWTLTNNSINRTRMTVPYMLDAFHLTASLLPRSHLPVPAPEPDLPTSFLLDQSSLPAPSLEPPTQPPRPSLLSLVLCSRQSLPILYHVSLSSPCSPTPRLPILKLLWRHAFFIKVCDHWFLL